MAGNVLIKNANGNTITLQNPDTNFSDVVVDTSKLNSLLGVNQTWQPVTRTASTTYYNTSGKPIMIKISIASTQAISASLTVSGSIVDQQYYNYGSGNQLTLSAIIPDGASYGYVAAGTGLAISTGELR